MKRYLKGNGPTTVKVTTAVTITNSGVTVAEDGIEPQVGEIWKIYTDSRHEPFDTSVCAGSTMLRSAARVALDLWSGFPVQAKPRPIIPLDQGVVVDPSTGFPDADTKMAYLQNRLLLRAPLPEGPGKVGRFRVISAADAYHRLHTRRHHIRPDRHDLSRRRLREDGRPSPREATGARVLISSSDAGAIPVTR